MIDFHTFVVNGRFLTRPTAGVDRVGLEMISALARRADVGRLVLLHPPVPVRQTDWLSQLGPEDRAKVELRPIGRGTGHAWEQAYLARAEPGRPLLSFCGTGPVGRRRQAVFLHDAQVWDVPESYSLPFRLAYRSLLPALARRARFLFTVSDFARSRLELHGVAPAGKATVIPNGADHMAAVTADPTVLDRHGLRPGGYFLAIGSLAPHKNLDRLIGAAAARSPGAPPLVVAGAADPRVFAGVDLTAGAGARARAGGGGTVDESVRVLGRVDDGELKALFEGAIALAFPSMTEGFGLPPVEAMSVGCPVIATTAGAVPEVCGDAAHYADPLRPDDWTQALERLAADDGLRRDLRQRGLARAATYRWATAAESLIGHLAA